MVKVRSKSVMKIGVQIGQKVGQSTRQNPKILMKSVSCSARMAIKGVNYILLSVDLERVDIGL